MKNKERITWIAMCMILSVSLLFGAREGAFVRQERDECVDTRDAKLKEAGEMLFECGETIEHQSKRCNDEGMEYIKRANLLFECEQDTCEKNGWMPPPDWEETKKVLGRR